MHKTKLFMAAALVAFSGIASADGTQSLYYPAPERGCGGSYYVDTSTNTNIWQIVPTLDDGSIFSTEDALGRPVAISCSNGWLTLSSNNSSDSLVTR